MKYIVLLLFFAIFALAANQDMQKGHKHEGATVCLRIRLSYRG